MKIGIIIGRIGDVDGVALETEKWIKILKELGHEVFILSGSFRKNVVDPDHEELIPNLSFFSPNCEWEQNRAFFFPPDKPDELLKHLHSISDGLAIRMFKWVMQNKLDLIISENASALPAHLSMGMAIKKLVDTTGIRVICHDHDFSWERGDRYKTPFPEIQQIFGERSINTIYTWDSRCRKQLLVLMGGCWDTIPLTGEGKKHTGERAQ